MPLCPQKAALSGSKSSAATPGSNSAPASAVLLDWVPGPAGGEEGAVIELHDAADRADPVVIVPRSWVRAVTASAVKRRRRPRSGVERGRPFQSS